MKSQETRPELILAALLYLVTAYRTGRCPGLASCIARHFQCLARHPDTDRLIRDVAVTSACEWESTARQATIAQTHDFAAAGSGLH